MDDQLKWYVVRAVSGKEKKVKQYIDSEISRLGLSERVPQVLIPMEKYYQMKEGKKITSTLDMC
jgi:transcriptional antiterminator NusG